MMMRRITEQFTTCVAYVQGSTATLAQGIIIEEFTSAMYVSETTAQNVRGWFRAVVCASSTSVRIAHLIIVPLPIVWRSFVMPVLWGIVKNAREVGASHVWRMMPSTRLQGVTVVRIG